MNKCIAVALFSVLMGTPVPALEIHVAQDGTPDAPGTLEQPVNSLERARDLLREQRAETEAATVWIHPGDYVLSDSFVLEARDGGAENAPVIYSAMPNAQVRLIGGRVVTGWTPVTDPAERKRLPADARDHVRVLDLRALGITDYGTYKGRGFGRSSSISAALELFFNDQAMTLARWPNDGFVTIAGFPKAHTKRNAHNRPFGEFENGFFYSDERPGLWQEPEKVWLHGYWMQDWADSHERIARIDLKAKHIFTAPPYGKYGFATGQRYYYSNILEELDQPGEWYLDHDTGHLFFWPPSALEEGEAIVSLLEGPLLELKNTSHVMIRGLRLVSGRNVGVRIEEGAHNRLVQCEVLNSGSTGITINRGKDHWVSGCTVAYPGDLGISLNGGDRNTLEPGGHRVVNTHIHHMGRWSRCYRPGIHISGAGNYVGNNLIHDGPHNAISFGGNNHLIELNEIHSVAKETGDVGAIYTGRDWTARGNVIRYNYIHHLSGLGGHGSMGVYLDDMASGFTVFGNIFYKGQHGIYMGGGRDNILENNLLIDMSREAIHIDARGASPIRAWREMRQESIKARLYDVLENWPNLVQEYPDLLRIQTLYEKHDAVVQPEGTAVLRNVIINSVTPMKLRDGLDTNGVLRIEGNLIQEGDPGFVNMDKMDFRLRPDSVVWRIGFKPIPIDQIGLYK